MFDILVYLFFFQAEDGIRDLTVTGVQTCALPIFLDRTTLPRCARDDGRNLIGHNERSVLHVLAAVHPVPQSNVRTVIAAFVVQTTPSAGGPHASVSTGITPVGVPLRLRVGDFRQPAERSGNW